MTPAAGLESALVDRYRIERELGAGGMATVYLAEDLKHDRKVAIKVLKPELAAVLGADRFVQEIKTTAQLQHPHILPLHDSGTADGFLFYVMPYIEGETLRNKLDRETQLGIDEAVRITREVADALDYAHRHGIIHRDIKPENILLHDGRPMVADFGIALAVSAAAGGRMTETGTSVGTPHYMSPEQATADKEITGRADQYSLASVLYEMLAGEPPHMGNSAQAVIMKIIADTPRPVTELRKSVPPNVAAALMKALEKLPADRFATAKQFEEALAAPSFRYTAGSAGVSGGRGAGRTAAALAKPGVAVAGWILAAILAAVVLWLVPSDKSGEGAPSFTILVDTLTTGKNNGVAYPAGGATFAGDGSLVFAKWERIYVRRPDTPVVTLLHKDEYQIRQLDTSPDGGWIVFSTFGGEGAGLRRISLAGGAPVTLLNEPSAGNPVWATDGWIYFRLGDNLARIRENGGQVDTVLAGAGLTPQDILPGGKGLLLTGRSSVLVMTLKTRDTVTVMPGRHAVRWSPTGHLVYVDPSGSLFAVPFDPDRRRVTGEPRAVFAGAATDAPSFDISRAGMLAYVSGPAGVARTDYYWVGRDGSTDRIPLPTVIGRSAAQLSPDGRRIAYIREGGVNVFDLTAGTDVRLAAGDHSPVWSPDGRQIAYADDARQAVAAVASDGSGDSRVLARLPQAYPSQWLADGTIIVESFYGDVFAITDTPGSPMRNLLVGNAQERSAHVSPDGRWLAYISDEDGVVRGYLRTWPGLGGKILVTGTDTVDNGTGFWSADSKTLFYQRSGHHVSIAVSIGTDGTPQPGRRAVTSLPDATLVGIDPRGTRLLVQRSGVAADRPDRRLEVDRLLILTNWLDELPRRMQESR